jgi:putative aldouronate transport system permease protein
MTRRLIPASRSERMGTFMIYAFMIVFNFVILYPFYYVVINSINATLVYGPAYFFPNKLTTYGYAVVFQRGNVLQALMVSTARTAAGIALTLTVTSACAFALKGKLRFRSLLLGFFVIPNFFQGGIIPRYLNFQSLGLLNNFFVYILPTAFQFFYFVVLMSAFRAIPDSLEESAQMDGANPFTIYARIYLPLSLPILATVALFQGVFQWNRWFDTVYFASRAPRLLTLSALLMRIIKQSEVHTMIDMGNIDIERNPDAIKFATMVITVAPIILIYPFLQRYFIKGLTLGSVKG